MSRNQCSHSKVSKITTDYPGGTISEHWECPDCNTRFWPESTDMHKIRLRDELAKAAMSGLVPMYGNKLVLAETSYEIADTMIAERNKPK